MSSRLLILALTLVAVATGGANLYLSGPEAVRAAQSSLDAQLERASKALPSVVAAGAQKNLGLASEVAQATTVQTALAELAKKNVRPDQAVLDMTREAVEARAEKRGDGEKNAALLVVATAKGAAEYRLNVGNEFTDEPAVPLVRDALGGGVHHALATLGGAYYRVAAVPVGSGETPVGAVAVGYPVDDKFVAAMRDSLGVDVTLLKGGQIVATSLPAEERGTLVATVAGGTPAQGFGFGDLPPDFSLFGMVDLPLFGDGLSAVRARNVRMPGIEGAEVVLSAPATAGLAPVADGQKRTIFLSGVVLVLGLLFTGLARNKGASVDPEDLESLADAAERAAGGDTSNKATEFLPGDLGRIARAVNKLASRARPASVPAPAPTAALGAHAEPPADVADQFPFGGETADAASDVLATELSAGPQPMEAIAEIAPVRENTPVPPADPAWATPGPAAAVPAMDPAPWDAPAASRSQTLGWGEVNTVQAGSRVMGMEIPGAPAAARNEHDFSGLLEETGGPAAALAAVERTPAPAAAPAGAPIDPFVQALAAAGQSASEPGFNPEATLVAAVPEALLRATSRAPAPAAPARPAPAPAGAVDSDEAHYQHVFAEFLATRERCGEPASNLTFEKFAAKLQKNREQLIEKYKCRTVRFTVYVKDGKAALKASPVKD